MRGLGLKRGCLWSHLAWTVPTRLARIEGCVLKFMWSWLCKKNVGISKIPKNWILLVRTKGNKKGTKKIRLGVIDNYKWKKKETIWYRTNVVKAIRIFLWTEILRFIKHKKVAIILLLEYYALINNDMRWIIKSNYRSNYISSPLFKFKSWRLLPRVMWSASLVLPTLKW